MQYTDIKNETFDKDQVTKYLSIRDPNATLEDLKKFLAPIEYRYSIYIEMERLESLPVGLFDHITGVRSVMLNNNPRLHTIHGLPAHENLSITIFNNPVLQTIYTLPFTQGLSLNITNNPILRQLPDGIWQQATLKSLRLENLPLIEINTPNINLPNLQGFSLIKMPLVKLPPLHAELLRSLKIETNSFQGFDKNQPELPKVKRIEIIGHAFQDIASLKKVKSMEQLIIQDCQTTLDWTELLSIPNTTFFTLKDCTSFTTSRDTACNRQIRIFYAKNCNIESLPPFIGKCTGLNQLLLENCPISTLPEELSEKRMLYEVRLSECHFSEIPPVVFKLPIESFSLNKNQHPLEKLPEDWSSLSKLRSLSLSNNNYTFENLDFLAPLNQLSRLSIEGNTLANKYVLIRDRKIPLEGYSILKGCKYTKRAEIIAACRALGVAKIPMEDKRVLLDLIWGVKKIQDLPVFDDGLLLKGLCVAWSPLNTHLRKLLLPRIEKHNGKPLHFFPNSVVYALGKLTLKKAELRQKLEQLKVVYAPKFSAKVTHVIIGNYPSQFDLFEQKGIQLCTEQQFQSYLTKSQPSFLQEANTGEDPQIIQNLFLLLENADPANHLIAVEMLKQGGVPNGMLEDLLILQKTHTSSKVRAEIKKLLEVHGSKEWYAILKDRQTFNKVSTGEEQEWVITKKLKKLATKTSPDHAIILSVLLYKKFGKGLRYTLTQKDVASSPLYEKVIQDLVQNGCLNWSKAIGRKQDDKLGTLDQYAHSYYNKTMKIPIQLLQNTPVHTINYFDCGMDKMPKETLAFEGVKKINFAYNNFSAFPEGLQNLPDLEHLDLSHNRLTVFPKEVLKLKKLKYLDLRGNPKGEEKGEGLVVLEEVKRRMKDCRILI